MAESPPIAPGYVYEIPPLDPGLQPRGAGGGLSVRVFPEPVEVGDRLSFGDPPDAIEWEVVAVEPTTRNYTTPLSGPPDWPGRAQLIMIRGKLVLRRVG